MSIYNIKLQCLNEVQYSWRWLCMQFVCFFYHPGHTTLAALLQSYLSAPALIC